MADVCERHNLKLLTYGTLVRVWSSLSDVGSLHDSLAVRWIFGRQVAEPTRTRSLLRCFDAVSAQGGNLFCLRSLVRLTKSCDHSQYLDMILKAWGDWALFQSLLAVLRDIGDRHGGLSIANIATRWVLDHPCVGAVIIGKEHQLLSKRRFISDSLGVRLGVSEHLDDNDRVFDFRLNEEDNYAIETVLARSNGRRMITMIGDCGGEYR